ncbi:MAG: LptF/LptG family permease [Acidobacteriota bacterium]
MLKSFDKYILKEIAAPFGVGLSIYTFTLLINMIFILSHTLISKGATTFTIIKILFYLLPDLLAFTIPMATLMGVLAGMSRMSTDSEIVALRTMGISNFRILRPIIMFSILTWLISSVLIMYVAPESNFQFQKLKTRIMLSRAMSNIKPRTFNREFPTYVLYFNDIDNRTNEWKDVFLYSRSDNKRDNIILAKKGKLIQDKDKRQSYFALKNATLHSFEKKTPGKNYFTTSHLNTSEEIPEFTNIKQARQSQQLIFPDLVKKMKEHPENILLEREYHRKFALPFACLALGFLALSLGISTKKGGKVSGFIISLGIIFIYYTTITTFQNLVVKKIVSPFLGMWAPNIFLFLSGIIFYFYSSKEKSLNWEKMFTPFRKLREIFKREKVPGRTGKVRFRLLKRTDWYIVKKMVSMLILIFLSLMLVFYIVRIVELIDSVIENNVPFFYVFKYVYFNTPEMISFVLPVSILTSVLLTFSLMSKNNEITAVQVSGISLYRVAIPAVILGIFLSLGYFLIQEKITPDANKKAMKTLDIIYKRNSSTELEFDKFWVSGKNNFLYFYDFLEKTKGRYRNFTAVQYDKNFALKLRLTSKFAVWTDQDTLILREGFIRKFKDNTPVEYSEFQAERLRIPGGKELFLKKISFPQHMNISQLREYIKYLKKNRSDPGRYEAKLYYKYSFPFSSLIMVLIAIPFSFKMGKKGTLFGIGIAVGISMVFWGIFGISSAMGSSGILSPLISAFAPIVLFSAISAWLFINIKT